MRIAMSLIASSIGHVKGTRMSQRDNNNSANRGFTLIEVALAIVVVGIGVLTVFGLISSGLDASRKAVADTEAALFAGAIMNAMRSEALLAADLSDPFTDNRWDKYWKDLRDGKTNVVVASFSAWGKSGDPALSIGFCSSDADVRKLSFVNRLFHDSSVTGLKNYELRYNLRMKEIVTPEDPVVTNRAVTLKIWDGLYGSATVDQALIFYSKFSNPGNM